MTKFVQYRTMHGIIGKEIGRIQVHGPLILRDAGGQLTDNGVVSAFIIKIHTDIWFAVIYYHEFQVSILLPLTGVGCVKKVVTELAVMEITPRGFKLLERAPGVSVEDIIQATEAELIIEGDVPEMAID